VGWGRVYMPVCVLTSFLCARACVMRTFRGAGACVLTHELSQQFSYTYTSHIPGLKLPCAPK